MDRIERHDFLNAVLLAVVLLGLAFALVQGTRTLFDTVEEGGGVIDSEKTPEATVPEQSAATTSPSTTEPEESTTTLAPPKPPNEVSVRVGNGAGKSGVAGAATGILENAGYDTLGAKNSTVRLDSSVVYYVEGFASDAAVVAELLNIPEESIAPMPSDPGVAQDTALLVVILGRDTTLG